MRITTARIIVQTLIMGMFLTLVFVTTFAHLDETPTLKFWLSKFLEIDPLIAIATSITTHTLYKGLIWSLVIIIPTLILGRIFCNWLCPFGIIHHFVGWGFNSRRPKAMIESNRYRQIYAIKYLILAGIIVAAFFGSLQIGLLDPLCLLHRSLTTSLLPAANMPSPVVEVFGDPKLHQFSWLIGFLILTFIGLNLVIPRFFCRVLCPLGATLGLLSRFSLWRIDRDEKACTDCGLCLKSCEGACDPHTKLRKSECFVCFNCIEDCPHDALKFAFLPARVGEVTWPDVSRRKAVFAAVTGLLFYPFTRLSARTTRNFSSKVIRPPGAVEELEFLERCLKCDQCIRVCPTNVLQPAVLEAGLEGLWTPVMNFRMGFCQLNCTACGQVCPTGAIQRLSLEQKQGLGQYQKDGPVKLGTAHYDLGRCLPWAKNTSCVVCEEVCPVSPKAIHAEYKKLLVRDGKKRVQRSSLTKVTLADYPTVGQTYGDLCNFKPNEFGQAQSITHYVEIIHLDGTSENHRVLSNDVDTLTIGQFDTDGKLLQGARFSQLPARGEVAAIYMELKLPKIDIELCIGCGICEKECPVVGDRRAVYVTPEGETRSQYYPQRDRNRSLRLMKNR